MGCVAEAGVADVVLARHGGRLHLAIYVCETAVAVCAAHESLGRQGEQGCGAWNVSHRAQTM
eukprot:6364264-Prymnesium_polylepis.1